MIEQFQANYLDRYEGVQVEIHRVSQSYESRAVSSTYLGKVNLTREYVLKTQEQFSLFYQSMTKGTVLDSTEY